MGEAVYYLAAKYSSEEEAEKAVKTVERIAKGVAFLNDTFHEIRHEKKASPREKVRFLSLVAGDLEESSEENVCVAEKLRTKFDVKPYLERKEEIGGFPDLTDLLPNDQSNADVPMNDIVHTLPDMTTQFMLSQHGCKILLSDYVWHFSRWDPLSEKIRELTEPEKITWVSDEYTTVGDLLLKLIGYEEVKV